MNASSEDARLLFDKWNRAAAPLRIKLTSSSLIFDGVGTVLDFTLSALRLGGHAWHLTVPLEASTYAFSDPREVPFESVREAETAQYEFGLSLRLSNGDQLAILELKASAQEDPRTSA